MRTNSLNCCDTAGADNNRIIWSYASSVARSNSFGMVYVKIF